MPNTNPKKQNNSNSFLKKLKKNNLVIPDIFTHGLRDIFEFKMNNILDERIKKGLYDKIASPEQNRNSLSKPIYNFDTAHTLLYLYTRFGNPSQNGDNSKSAWEYNFTHKSLFISLHASYHSCVYPNFYFGVDKDFFEENKIKWWNNENRRKLTAEGSILFYQEYFPEILDDLDSFVKSLSKKVSIRDVEIDIFGYLKD